MRRGFGFRFVVGVVCVMGIGAAALARDLYVSPTGTPAGDGSKQKPLDVSTALSARSPARPGDTLYLMGGTYEGAMRGTTRVPFALAVSGTKDQPIKIMPVPGESAHLNGTGAMTSSYAQYIALDIGDLEWDPYAKKHQADTALNVTGGTGAKVINCNIFGGEMGTGLWSTAVDLEVYGCLVHDFGGLPDGPGRGSGHAFYTQNERGTKVISNNIAYRGCGWNLHVYGQAGLLVGYDITENIMYIAGAYKPGQTMDNYLVYGYLPADRIRMLRNVGYQPTDVERWRPNARMSHLKPVQNLTGEVKDNYFMGAFYGLSVGDWKHIEITGNTLWATGVLMEINSAPTGSGLGKRDAKPDLAGYTVDNNTYIANGKDRPFLYVAAEKLDEKELISFAQWQALGLDKNSQLIQGKGGKPTGAKMFVFPNKYQKSRANVGIFNWDGLQKVEVDLSAVLAKGQKYVVYNCLDIQQTITKATPVLQGTFDGAKVAFPMRKDPISPDFDAFLVLPLE